MLGPQLGAKNLLLGCLDLFVGAVERLRPVEQIDRGRSSVVEQPQVLLLADVFGGVQTLEVVVPLEEECVLGEGADEEGTVEEFPPEFGEDL